MHCLQACEPSFLYSSLNGGREQFHTTDKKQARLPCLQGFEPCSYIAYLVVQAAVNRVLLAEKNSGRLHRMEYNVGGMMIKISIVEIANIKNIFSFSNFYLTKKVVKIE